MAAGGDGRGRGPLFDALVLGAGIQGSFAAYHLARRRLKTLLLDQFPLPHTRGSSHGQSRISRSAYPQEHYLALMAEARRLWAQLEAEAGTRLHRPMLALVVGHQENPEFQGYRQAMEHHRVPSETLSPQQLAHRFPGIHPHGGEMAVADHTAGVLYANKALKVVQDLFQSHKGTLRDGEKVLHILPGPVVTVTTSHGRYQAKRLVVTAGAWTNHLLAPLGLQLPLQPLRIRVCYLRAKVPGPEGLLGQPPCFLGIGLNQDKHHFYGLLSGEYPDLVKVCYHHGSPADPDRPNQQVQASPPVPDLQRLQDFVSKYLPGLDPEPAVQEWCLYTICRSTWTRQEWTEPQLIHGRKLHSLEQSLPPNGKKVKIGKLSMLVNAGWAKSRRRVSSPGTWGQRGCTEGIFAETPPSVHLHPPES